MLPTYSIRIMMVVIALTILMYIQLHQQISLVTPVTDLEVATGAYSAGSGQWLSYMEKSFW